MGTWAGGSGAGWGAFTTSLGGSGAGRGGGALRADGGGAAAIFGLGVGGSAALGGGSGTAGAGGRAGLPSGAFSSGLSGAMSTKSGSPRLAYSGGPSVSNQRSEPSSKMWTRIEQTIAMANTRRVGCSARESLTNSDYAMAGRRPPIQLPRRPSLASPGSFLLSGEHAVGDIRKKHWYSAWRRARSAGSQ